MFFFLNFIQKSVISTIQNPVISQKDNNGTGNYEPDFDESNDDDDRRPSSSRYVSFFFPSDNICLHILIHQQGRPRISDAHLSDSNYNSLIIQDTFFLNSYRRSWW